ncbi:mannosyltransferase putative-domain-containing protein [Gongronella butleri]|nr:mannosyltransferase putative-domain-containing protein [Gongronella butleri]
MTVNLRTMKSLHTYFDERGIRSPEQVRHRDLAAWHLLHQLVDRHLEWLKKGYSDIFDVQRQSMTEKRGFAMCVGDNKFAYAVHALAALREVHGNELPVEIFFRDDDDLSKRYQQYLLSKFANIRLRRLDQIFENYILELRGWDMKPFSVLASSFKEVMLIDADALFLYNPDKLFDEQGFKDTGTLFFKDRTLLQWPRFGGRQWVESFLPSYSDWLPKSRWWMGETDFELHSPVVLFDKQKTLWSIIAACKLMDKWEREQQTFVYSHGDKEAFWLGAEMTLTPFTFVSGVPMALGGFIEGVMENGYVCGTVALPDSTGRPFWWNGGMYHTAFGQRRIIQFDFYALGSYHVSGPECMMERDFIYDLPEEAAQAGKEHVDIVKRYKVDLALLHQGAYPLV